MRFSPRLSPPSLFSMDAVRRVVGNLLSEERCRARRRCWFYAVSVDIRNGGTVQAQYSPEPDGPWDSPFLDHVLGSIAVPYEFHPSEPLNMSVFGFKKAECRWAFDLGLQDAETSLQDLPARRIF